ncbi:hypothetical protein ISS85_02320 [Candidatus Microgenomates bacterium]|nr:hypothetical protein [Candidatus Microgenomates bacterium]
MNEQGAELHESHEDKPSISPSLKEKLRPATIIMTRLKDRQKNVKVVASDLLEGLAERYDRVSFEIARHVVPAMIAVGDAALSATGVAGTAESGYRLWKDLPEEGHRTDLANKYWFYATLPAREVFFCASTPRLGRKELEFNPATLTAMRAYDLATTAISAGYGAVTHDVTGAVGSKLLLNFAGRLAVNAASICKFTKG